MTRDDIIRWAEEAGVPGWSDVWALTEDHLERFAALVAAAERAACAKVCDTHIVDDILVGVGIAQSCAAAIRARGNA